MNKVEKKQADTRQNTGDVPTIPEKLIPLLAGLSAEERRSALLAVKVYGETAVDILVPLLNAGKRTRMRRRSDKQTDGRRRVLVGARVPREFAQACRKEANERGVSLYAWVVMALREALCAGQWEETDDADPFYGW